MKAKLTSRLYKYWDKRLLAANWTVVNPHEKTWRIYTSDNSRAAWFVAVQPGEDFDCFTVEWGCAPNGVSFYDCQGHPSIAEIENRTVDTNGIRCRLSFLAPGGIDKWWHCDTLKTFSGYHEARELRLGTLQDELTVLEFQCEKAHELFRVQALPIMLRYPAWLRECDFRISDKLVWTLHRRSGRSVRLCKAALAATREGQIDDDAWIIAAHWRMECPPPHWVWFSPPATAAIMARFLTAFAHHFTDQLAPAVPYSCRLVGAETPGILKHRALLGLDAVYAFFDEGNGKGTLCRTDGRRVINRYRRHIVHGDCCVFDDSMTWCLALDHNDHITLIDPGGFFT